MTQTILIIGASNPVGNALMQAMPDDPAYTVRVAVRPGAAADAVHANVTTVSFDFFIPETLEAALAGVDRVFLATPFDSSQGLFAQLVADAAKEAGVKHIVLFSSLGADKAPELPIFQLYRQMEASIEASGVAYTHLRSAPLMDNFLSIHPLDADGKVTLPLGEAYVAWIAATDVAAVAVAVLTGEGHEGKAYDLTGPQALTVGQATAWMRNALARDMGQVASPLDDGLQRLQGRRLSPWAAENLLALYGVPVAGDAGAASTLAGHPFLENLSDAVLTLTGKPSRGIAEFAAAHTDKSAMS